MISTFVQRAESHSLQFPPDKSPRGFSPGPVLILDQRATLVGREPSQVHESEQRMGDTTSEFFSLFVMGLFKLQIWSD